MTTLTVRIPEDLNAVLEEFCKTDERSKSWFVKKALQNYLEDLEDQRLAQKLMKEREMDIKNGTAKTYTLEEVMASAGITREELDKAKFDFSDCD